jgi:hypothetical protein
VPISRGSEVGQLSLAQNKNQRRPGQSVSHPLGKIKSRVPEKADNSAV